MQTSQSSCHTSDGITINVYIDRGNNSNTAVVPVPDEQGRVKWTLGPVKTLRTSNVPQGTANTVHIQRRADMALILTDVQKVGLSVSFVTAKGNPAQVDGAPVWSVSDATVLSVVPSADGLSAEVVAVGPLGTAQVSVTADADLGTGVTALVGTLDVQVVASEAASIVINAGAPVAQ